MADLEMVDVPQRLKDGIKLVNHGSLEEARSVFQGYLDAQPDSALALSFLGMIKGIHDRDHLEGLEQCQEALMKDSDEPLCYLNLARVHLAMGDRFQCIRAIQRGLKQKSPHRDQLMGFYRTIGVRRKPPLGFLSRNNFLNEILGRFSWKIKGR
jgi:predicted Zn-dependent protease